MNQERTREYAEAHNWFPSVNTKPVVIAGKVTDTYDYVLMGEPNSPRVAQAHQNATQFAKQGRQGVFLVAGDNMNPLFSWPIWAIIKRKEMEH